MKTFQPLPFLFAFVFVFSISGVSAQGEDDLSDLVTDDTGGQVLTTNAMVSDKCNFEGLAKTRCQNAYKAIADNLSTHTQNDFRPWTDPYQLRAPIELYKVTKDKELLTNFTTLADYILSKRASVTNQKDFAGYSRPCWITTKYSLGKKMCWVVHAGFTLTPMMEFAYIVKNDPVLSQDANLVAKSDAYILAAEQAVTTFNSSYYTKSAGKMVIPTGSGYYLFKNNMPVQDKIKGLGLPHNQQLAMATTIAYLYKLTGKEEYKTKVDQMTRVLVRDLSLKNGAYKWHYWWGTSLKVIGTSKYEDVGHAFIDIEFVHTLKKLGLVTKYGTRDFPTNTDMQRFANTFLKGIYRTASSMSFRVDGTDPQANRSSLSGKFIILAPYNQEIANKVKLYDNKYKLYNSSNIHNQFISIQLLNYGL